MSDDDELPDIGIQVITITWNPTSGHLEYDRGDMDAETAEAVLNRALVGMAMDFWKAPDEGEPDE